MGCSEAAVRLAPEPGGADPALGRHLDGDHARVAELADAQDLGSCGATRGGSSPPFRTRLEGFAKEEREDEFPLSHPIRGSVLVARGGSKNNLVSP